MKKTIQRLYAPAAFVAAFAMLFLAGCTKDTTEPGTSHTPDTQQLTAPVTDKPTQIRIDEVLETVPGFAIYNEPRGEYILINFNDDNPKFNFASPNAGFTFSSPGGGYEFVQGSDGQFYQIITPGTGGGTGGGLVTAGSYVLDVNMVMCFNSGENEFGGLFDFSDISGVSGAFGVAGNFDALMNGEFDENADITDYFHGIVAFYAFDGTASGSYQVIDFMDVEEDIVDPDGKAIALFWTFLDGGALFFSESGNVSFGSSSVEFNGTYIGITGAMFSSDEDFENASYVTAQGFGALNCM